MLREGQNRNFLPQRDHFHKIRVFKKILKKNLFKDTKKKLDDFYTKLKRQNDDRQVLRKEKLFFKENTTKNQRNQCQKDKTIKEG